MNSQTVKTPSPILVNLHRHISDERPCLLTVHFKHIRPCKHKVRNSKHRRSSLRFSGWHQHLGTQTHTHWRRLRVEQTVPWWWWSRGSRWWWQWCKSRGSSGRYRHALRNPAGASQSQHSRLPAAQTRPPSPPLPPPSPPRLALTYTVHTPYHTALTTDDDYHIQMELFQGTNDLIVTNEETVNHSPTIDTWAWLWMSYH